jgi:acetylornithine deacetylase/succinyl-diaminopimelate desuccinylase-like protein
VNILLLAALCFGAGSGEAAPGSDGDLAALVKKDRIVELTQKMIRINSEYEKDVTHNHREIADFIARELKDIGVEVEVIRQNPDFPIVVGSLGDSAAKPALGITELYNTVYIGDRSLWSVDPLGGLVKDGKIWGRGAANSKGSLAASLEAARAVKASGEKLRGKLVLLYTPGEGGQEFCLPWVVENRPELIRADWYLAGGGGGNLTRMAGGHVWLKLIVRGIVAHPGAMVQNRPPINAIHKLAQLIPAIMNVDDWMTWEPHPLFANYVSSRGVGKPFVEFGKIAGGYEVNMVPDRAEADFDIRLFPKQTPEKVLAELDGLLGRLKQEDPDLHVEVKRIGAQVVPYHYWSQLTDDDPLIKTIFEVAPSYTGRKPEWKMSAGGGRPDLWQLGAKWISFGLVEGDGAHATDEWVDIDSLVEHAKIYADLAARMLR